MKVFDRHAMQDPEYSLIMQNEEINPFIDPFRAADEPSSFASALSDTAELPWPRRISESSKSGDNLLGSNYSSDLRFGMDMGCRWLQVSWRPGAYVVAVSHSDGIHLLEALC